MNNKLPKEQETFNEETISALNEVDEMRKHPEQYPSYTSVDTMFDTLLKEDTSKNRKPWHYAKGFCHLLSFQSFCVPHQ